MRVQFKASFGKDLKRIGEAKLRQRIKQTIEQLEQAQSLNDVSDLKKLRVGHNYYRIRVGEYRIGLAFEGDTMMLVRCLNRKDFYRYFP